MNWGAWGGAPPAPVLANEFLAAGFTRELLSVDPNPSTPQLQKHGAQRQYHEDEPQPEKPLPPEELSALNLSYELLRDDPVSAAIVFMDKFGGETSPSPPSPAQREVSDVLSEMRSEIAELVRHVSETADEDLDEDADEVQERTIALQEKLQGILQIVGVPPSESDLEGSGTEVLEQASNQPENNVCEDANALVLDLVSVEYERDDECSRMAYLGQATHDGLCHGKGVLWWNDGARYMGEWKDDKPCGNGIESYTDGSFYKGEFLHDARSGVGVFCRPDGTAFCGTWAGGDLIGLGFTGKLEGTGKASYCAISAYRGTVAKMPYTDTAQMQSVGRDVATAMAKAECCAEEARIIALSAATGALRFHQHLTTPVHQHSFHTPGKLDFQDHDKGEITYDVLPHRPASPETIGDSNAGSGSRPASSGRARALLESPAAISRESDSPQLFGTRSRPSSSSNRRGRLIESDVFKRLERLERHFGLNQAGAADVKKGEVLSADEEVIGEEEHCVSEAEGDEARGAVRSVLQSLCGAVAAAVSARGRPRAWLTERPDTASAHDWQHAELEGSAAGLRSEVSDEPGLAGPADAAQSSSAGKRAETVGGCPERSTGGEAGPATEDPEAAGEVETLALQIASQIEQLAYETAAELARAGDNGREVGRGANGEDDMHGAGTVQHASLGTSKATPAEQPHHADSGRRRGPNEEMQDPVSQVQKTTTSDVGTEVLQGHDTAYQVDVEEEHRAEATADSLPQPPAATEAPRDSMDPDASAADAAARVTTDQEIATSGVSSESPPAALQRANSEAIWPSTWSGTTDAVQAQPGPLQRAGSELLWPSTSSGETGAAPLQGEAEGSGRAGPHAAAPVWRDRGDRRRFSTFSEHSCSGLLGEEGLADAAGASSEPAEGRIQTAERESLQGQPGRGGKDPTRLDQTAYARDAGHADPDRACSVPIDEQYATQDVVAVAAPRVQHGQASPGGSRAGEVPPRKSRQQAAPTASVPGGGVAAAGEGWEAASAAPEVAPSPPKPRAPQTVPAIEVSESGDPTASSQASSRLQRTVPPHHPLPEPPSPGRPLSGLVPALPLPPHPPPAARHPNAARPPTRGHSAPRARGPASRLPLEAQQDVAPANTDLQPLPHPPATKVDSGVLPTPRSSRASMPTPRLGSINAAGAERGPMSLTEAAGMLVSKFSAGFGLGKGELADYTMALADEEQRKCLVGWMNSLEGDRWLQVVGATEVAAIRHLGRGRGARDFVLSEVRGWLLQQRGPEVEAEEGAEPDTGWGSMGQGVQVLVAGAFAIACQMKRGGRAAEGLSFDVMSVRGVVLHLYVEVCWRTWRREGRERVEGRVSSLRLPWRNRSDARVRGYRSGPRAPSRDAAMVQPTPPLAATPRPHPFKRRKAPAHGDRALRAAADAHRTGTSSREALEAEAVSPQNLTWESVLAGIQTVREGLRLCGFGCIADAWVWFDVDRENCISWRRLASGLGQLGIRGVDVRAMLAVWGEGAGGAHGLPDLKFVRIFDFQNEYTSDSKGVQLGGQRATQVLDEAKMRQKTIMQALEPHLRYVAQMDGVGKGDGRQPGPALTRNKAGVQYDGEPLSPPRPLKRPVQAWAGKDIEMGAQKGLVAWKRPATGTEDLAVAEDQDRAVSKVCSLCKLNHADGFVSDDQGTEGTVEVLGMISSVLDRELQRKMMWSNGRALLPEGARRPVDTERDDDLW